MLGYFYASLLLERERNARELLIHMCSFGGSQSPLASAECLKSMVSTQFQVEDAVRLFILPFLLLRLFPIYFIYRFGSVLMLPRHQLYLISHYVLKCYPVNGTARKRRTCATKLLVDRR